MICYVRQSLCLCLYNTGISKAIAYVFHETKPYKVFTNTEPGTNFNFTEVLQDFCCLHMLVASIKEKKGTPRAWIQVCTARDHPNAIRQSILIHALCLY